MNLHHSRKRKLRCAAWLLSTCAVASWYVGSAAVAEEKVTGRRGAIGDVPVAWLWGAPEERGTALGYLFADEIVDMLDGYISNPANGGPQQYERMVAFSRQRMAVDDRYRAELFGMMKGITAKRGEPPTMKSLGRRLNDVDLLTFNCLPELSMLGCSSFAVWGEGSGVGGTLAGRNLDWRELNQLLGTAIIVVHAPAEGGSRRGWVSITWPPYIGCLTGMNEEGVTVSMHDVSVGPPGSDGPFVPRGFALRDAIESARASTAFDDIAAVLRKRRCAVGNNVPVNCPYRDGEVPSVVFEYDGHKENGGGVTVRKSGTSARLVCTNHYVKRAAPRECRRYDTIEKRLSAMAKSHTALGLEQGWETLFDVAYRRGRSGSIITYYSVLFEPNRRRMHVAIAGQDRPVTEATPVELDITALLRDAKQDAGSTTR